MLPGLRFYAHKILKIEQEDPPAFIEEKQIFKFTIGNNKGWENGYCYDHLIYGRLVEVVT